MALQTKSISANGSKGHHKFTLTVTENSTSTSGNTSSVSWSFVLSPIVKSYDWNYNNTVPVTYSININGTTYSGNIMSYDGSSTVTVRSSSTPLTITHNSDGNKSISYSFSVSSISASYLPGSASASGSMALTYIPRAATISSAPNFTDEQNPTITYSNPAGNAVTSLQACISLTGATDDIAYMDISKTGTSYTFPLTDAEKNVLRNATLSGKDYRTVYFFIATTIGGTVYRKSVGKTLTIVNANPTLSPVVQDIGSVSTTLTGDANKIIKGFNSVSITINATALKGNNSITSQKVTCGGKSLTSASGTLQNVESNIFDFTVTDKRGLTTTKRVTKTLINYVPLTCNLNASIALSSSDQTLATATLNINGKYFNDSFGAVDNELTVQYRYKTNDGDYGDWTPLTATTGSNSTYTATGTITGLSYQDNYTFQARALDKVYTGGISTPEKVLKTTPVFDWGEGDFKFNVPAYDAYGTRIGNGLTMYTTGMDANTTLEHEILTNVNTPTSAYYYITTIFYNDKTSSSARTQMAAPYNGSSDNNIYFRRYYDGSWTSWTKVAKSQLANQEVIYGTTTSGTAIEAINPCSSSNNCVIGNGGYASNIGATNIYGYDVNIYTKSNFSINGREYGVNKVLWSGIYHMNSSHTATLSEAISKQPHGVIIVFTEYNNDNSAVQNSNITSFFVSKYSVSTLSDCGNTFFLPTPFNRNCIKYLYIADTVLRGAAVNVNSPTISGIQYKNLYAVLRYVIGV